MPRRPSAQPEAPARLESAISSLSRAAAGALDGPRSARARGRTRPRSEVRGARAHIARRHVAASAAHTNGAFPAQVALSLSLKRCLLDYWQTKHTICISCGLFTSSHSSESESEDAGGWLGG